MKQNSWLVLKVRQIWNIILMTLGTLFFPAGVLKFTFSLFHKTTVYHLYCYLLVMMNDDDELLLWYGWPTKGVALFPAGTTVRDPHHRKSRESTPQAGFEPLQNLSSGFDEWSCAVVITTTSQRYWKPNPTLHLQKDNPTLGQSKTSNVLSL